MKHRKEFIINKLAELKDELKTAKKSRKKVIKKHLKEGEAKLNDIE